MHHNSRKLVALGNCNKRTADSFPQKGLHEFWGFNQGLAFASVKSQPSFGANNAVSTNGTELFKNLLTLSFTLGTNARKPIIFIIILIHNGA